MCARTNHNMVTDSLDQALGPLDSTLDTQFRCARLITSIGSTHTPPHRSSVARASHTVTGDSAYTSVHTISQTHALPPRAHRPLPALRPLRPPSSAPWHKTQDSRRAPVRARMLWCELGLAHKYGDGAISRRREGHISSHTLAPPSARRTPPAAAPHAPTRSSGDPRGTAPLRCPTAPSLS